MILLCLFGFVKGKVGRGAMQMMTITDNVGGRGEGAHEHKSPLSITLWKIDCWIYSPFILLNKLWPFLIASQMTVVHTGGSNQILTNAEKGGWQGTQMLKLLTKGERALALCWQSLTKGGRGVINLLTITEKRENGGPDNPGFGKP